MGNRGFYGFPGSKTDALPPGPTGPAGPAGASVTGATGNTGATGVGATGATGATGAAGSIGLGWTAPPVLSSWTWVNQGSAVASDGTSPSSILLGDPGGVGYHVRLLERAIPATPYAIIAAIVPTVGGSANTGRVGIALRQSSNDHFLTFFLGYVGSIWEYVISEYTNNSTLSSNLANQTAPIASPTWLKIADSGTTITFSISGDGQQWFDLASIGHSAFLTADQCGLCVDCTSNNTKVWMQVVSWAGA